MQCERQMRVVKLYQGQMQNKIVEQSPNIAYQKIEVVGVVLQVTMQSYLLA